MSPLFGLTKQGQSIWLDYIRRSFLTSGDFRRLVEEDGVRGVTSNPTIFEKAIDGSSDYDDALRALLDETSRGSMPARLMTAWLSKMSGWPPIFCGRRMILAAVPTGS